jgi:epoxide hydrolase-like predicted phosphatase
MTRMEDKPRGLLIDWGGVLTSGLPEAMRAWAEADGIDYDAYYTAMTDWLETGLVEAELNPIHALERGQIAVPDFERKLAAVLRRADGGPVPAEGLIERMFAHFEHQPQMSALVRRARTAGIRTALLSNSWGNRYPRDTWDGMFDAIVISGEIGLRKPEPEIYRYAADAVGLVPNQCVFVDDMRRNVAAAQAVGMRGLHHIGYEDTRRELETLFGLDLR